MSFDPSALTLSGWWRGSYSSAPWNGTSSGGASGSHALAHTTNDPTSGTAVNGFNPAAYASASSQQLVDTTDLMSDLLSVSAYTIIALFNATSAFTATGTITDSPCFLTDFGGIVGLTYDSNGVTLFHDDGAYKTFTVAAGTGSWQVVMAYYDGTNLWGRLNNGVWSNNGAIVGNLLSIANSIRNGTNWAAANFYDGSILEIITAQSVLSRNRLDDIGLYLQDRYALSLGFLAPGAIAVVPDYLDSQRWRRRRAETALQRHSVESFVSAYPVPNYKESRYPDYVPRAGRTREYFRASLQQETTKLAPNPVPLPQPGIGYGYAPDIIDAASRQRKWMAPALQMDVDRRNIAPRELALTQLTVGMSVHTDQVDPDNAIRPFRREIAARQPFEGRANTLPVPLPQPGTGYGYQPPFLQRNWPLRVRMRTALMPFSVIQEKVERSSTLADVDWSDRVAVPRPLFHASQQKDTALPESPIPLPQPGFGYGACPDQIAQSGKLRKWFAIPTQQFWSPMELLPIALPQPGGGYGWWPDVIENAARLARWFRTAQQKDTHAPESPLPLAQPGVGYDSFPARVVRPTPHADTLPQADATAAFFSSTAATLTPVDLVRHPDGVVRAQLRADRQMALHALGPQAERTSPLADSAFADRPLRWVTHATRQPFTTDVSPQPERTASLADVAHPERVPRPRMPTSAQLFTTSLPPAPERTQQLADAVWIDRPWRPSFRTSWQLDTTQLSQNPLPLDQPGVGYAVFQPTVIRPSFSARTQPFTTEIPSAPIALPQPGIGIGWQPERVDRPGVSSWAYRTGQQLDTTKLSALPIPLAQPGAGYATYPDAVVRPAFRAERQLDTTNFSPLPIVAPFPGVQFMRFQDAVSRPTFHARWQQETTKLAPSPLALAQPGAGYACYVDRVVRPAMPASAQLFLTNEPPRPEQTLPLDHEPTFPDAVRRPTYAAAEQPFFVVNVAPEQTSELADALYPWRVDRPALRAERQQPSLVIAPQPERTTPLADVVYPERVRRPAFDARMQPFTTDVPARPETTLPLDWQPSFQAAVPRPTFAAAEQQATALYALPLFVPAVDLVHFPGAVARPRYGAPEQPFFATSPAPEEHLQLDWQPAFPERITRASLRAEHQQAYDADRRPEAPIPLTWQPSFQPRVPRAWLPTSDFPTYFGLGLDFVIPGFARYRLFDSPSTRFVIVVARTTEEVVADTPQTRMAFSVAPATNILVSDETQTRIATMNTLNVYDVGDTAECSAELWVKGVLTDPTDLYVDVKPPTASQFTLRWGVDAALVRDAAGKFRALVDCTEAGQWQLYWRSTGAAKGAEPTQFTVRIKPF